MEELGGKSLFKSLPDWHERPILGAMLEHGKDLHATGEFDCFQHQGTSRINYANSQRH